MSSIAVKVVLCSVGLVAATGIACSSSSDAPNDALSGGTGGTPGGAAGSAASGGATTAGGGAPSGGNAVTSSGGAATGSGGNAIAMGGAAGSGTAGAANNGGAPSAGGGANGGAGGAGAKPAGCGKTGAPPSGKYSIDVSGTSRDYIIALPNGYDPSKPYKLVFAWHGLGGSAQQVAGTGNYGWYGLASRANGSAIFVAGQGLPTSTSVGDGAGWPNTNGQDVAFTRALVDYIEANYCVDTDRIFSVGMSYGGIMSNTVGCQMGDVFRAIAPMSGSGPRANAQCKDQVAVWMSHGNQDTTVPFAQGQASRDKWVAANHCTTTTAPVAPGTCVAYQGCDAGYPVHWCEFDGGHTIPSFAAEGIWNFLSQF